LLSKFKKIIRSFSEKEHRLFLIATAIFVLSSIFKIGLAINGATEVIPVSGGSYREGVIGQPTFINPVISNNQIDLDISSLIYPRLETLLDNYDIQENGRVYVLTLKEGLVWNNDKKLTSDDVIFTIKLIQNPEVHSPFFESWQGIMADRTSELQVKLTLSAPYAFFADQIKHLLIVPKSVFGHLPPDNLKLSNYNLEPIGAGPYNFKSFSKRKDGFITQYHLYLNRKYAGDKPFLRDFYFKFYENLDDLLKDFRLRQIDGFGSLQPLNPQTDFVPKTNTFYLPMSRYYAIFFNANNNPLLKQRNFRSALAQAIDRNKIILEVFQNQAKKIDGPIINNSENDSITYNPSASRKLLTDINVSTTSFNLVVPKIDFLQKTASLVKENWQAIGLTNVNIIELEPADVLNQVIKSREYEMILFGNVLNNNSDLFPFWHSTQRFYPGLNLSLYSNQKVDTLIENIRQNRTIETQKQQLDQIQELIKQDIPAIFLYSLPYVYIQNKEVEGLTIKQIVWPSDRFNEISHWYLKTARVFK